MKNILCAFLLFTAVNNCLGQFYRPFPEGTAIWTILSVQGPPPLTLYDSYILQEGDTIIENNSYHKLYRYSYTRDGSDSLSGYPFADTGYIAGIRENVNLKRVYIFYNGDTGEKLLYDFSIDTTGAPFPKTVLNWGDTFNLTSADTTTLPYTGVLTRDFNYWDSVTGFAYDIYEGVGPDVGGLTRIPNYPPPGSSVELSEYIICLYSDDAAIYEHYLDPFPYPDCATMLTLAISALPNGSHLKVSPNPANDYLYITYNDLPAEHHYYFTVYNILGQAVLTQPLAPAGTTLPCASWQAGLYIWEVRDESGNKLTEGKVVKNP